MMNLVALCASHINCKERLHSIQIMINSLLDQKEPINIFVSISSEKELLNELNDIINSYNNKYDIIKFIFHSQKQSQFEHYKSLCVTYFNNKDITFEDTWCLFCDDDDFCNPSRSSFYKTEIIKIISNEKHNSIVYPKYQSIYFVCSEMQHCCKEDECYNILEPIDSRYHLSKITALLDKNEAKITDGGQDYFMFCCRIDVLKFFFDIVSNDIIKDLGCDLVFRNLLRCLPCKIVNINNDTNKNNWLYAHTRNYALKPATLYVNYEKIVDTWTNVKYDLNFKWGNKNEFDLSMKQFWKLEY